MNGGGEGEGEGAEGSKAAGGGGLAVRVPSWKERENNRRRERRRRSIAAKIFGGLRTCGNYELPRNCDNNEVLRALCNEAGWTVEPDGTTYRKGCKPPPAAADHAGTVRSTTVSSGPSYPLSPSPASSSSQITLGGGSNSTNLFFASGAASSNGGGGGGADAGGSSSFLPWLKAMTGSGSGPSSFPSYGATNFSAPVTPPAASPPPLRKMARRAADNAVAEGSSAAHYALPPWVIGGATGSSYAAPSYTTPSSRGGRRVPADPATWLPAGFQQAPSARGNGPAYSPVLSPGPFGAFPGSSRLGMLSGLSIWPCSPAVPHGGAVPSLALRRGEATGSAWEGEVINECNEEELELTLGSARTRADRA